MHEQPSQAGGLGGGRAAGGSVVGEVDLGDQAEGETASKRCGHGNKGAGLSEQDDGRKSDDQGGAYPAVEEEQGYAARSRNGHGRYHGHHERAEQQDGLKGDAFHPLGTHHARDAHDGEHDEDAEPRAPESRQGGSAARLRSDGRLRAPLRCGRLLASTRDGSIGRTKAGAPRRRRRAPSRPWRIPEAR